MKLLRFLVFAVGRGARAKASEEQGGETELKRACGLTLG